MDEVEVGDLVRWQAGEKTRVGVIESVNTDGTCTINMKTKGGKRTEKIRTQRLEVITSTIKPTAETEPKTPPATEEPGNPSTEAPFQGS